MPQLPTVADGDADHAQKHNDERAEINRARSRSTTGTTSFAGALVLDFSEVALTKVDATASITSFSLSATKEGLTDGNSAVVIVTNTASTSISVALSAIATFADAPAADDITLQPGAELMVVLWSSHWEGGAFWLYSSSLVSAGSSSAVTFVAAAAPSAKFAAGAPKTITVPAGTQGGDRIIVFPATTQGSTDEPATLHAADGFTQRLFGTTSGGYVPRISILDGVASGTPGQPSPDVGSTVTVTTDGDGDGAVGLIVLRNASSIKPGGAVVSSGGSVWADPAAVTVDDVNEMILVFSAVEDFNPDDSGDIAGFVKVFDSGSDSGSAHSRGIACWRKTPTATGSVNPAKPDGTPPGNSTIATLVAAP